jgi:hypothetical protein
LINLILLFQQIFKKSKKEEQSIRIQNTKNQFFPQWHLFKSDRGVEMYLSGEGFDCVIEVHEKDGKNKVLFNWFSISKFDKSHQQTEFNVHKFVLATNSDIFHAMLSNNANSEARVQITDSTGTAVRQMIHYIYTGKLPVNYDIKKDALPLMDIASKYQINPLIEFIGHKFNYPKDAQNDKPIQSMRELYQEIKEKKSEHVIHGMKGNLSRLKSKF